MNNFDASNAGGNKNEDRSGDWRSRNVYSPVDRSFKGTTQEIGGVLALPVETHVQFRVNFTKFQELFTGYSVKKFGEAATPEVVQSIQ